MPKIDFTGEPEFTVLPEKRYKLAIQSGEIKQKANAETKYIEWKLNVVGDEACEGTPVTIKTTLIKGKRWALKQLLRACDIHFEEETCSFEFSDLVGKVISADCKIESRPYQKMVAGQPTTMPGRPQNTFSNFQPEIPF